MDERDLLLWALIALPMVLVCCAGQIWIDNLDGRFSPRVLRELWQLTAPTLIALVFAPPLAVRIGGPRLGVAFGRGLALSLVLLALAAALVLPPSERWPLRWAIFGALSGLAVGVGWAVVLPRRCIALLLFCVGWGMVAGGFSMMLRGLPHFSGWAFGVIWAAAGLPLAWLLRAHYAPGFETPYAPPIHYRNAMLPTLGAAALLALGIGGAHALRPCGPLGRIVAPNACVNSVAIGDLYNLFSLEFSPDGKSLFLGGGRISSWGAIEQRRLSDGALVTRFPTDDALWIFGVAPSGNTLVALDRSDTIYVWDLRTGNEVRRFAAEPLEQWNQVRFSADERYVVFWYSVYDLETGAVVDSALRSGSEAFAIAPQTRGLVSAWSPDGVLQTVPASWAVERVTAADYAYAYDVALVDGALRIGLRREIAPEDIVHVLPGPLDQSPRFAFSSDGAYLAGLYRDHYIALGYPHVNDYLRIWHIASEAVVFEERIESIGVNNTYAWAPNEPILAIADQFGPVRLIRVGE
jgi:hypothetical protein